MFSCIKIGVKDIFVKNFDDICMVYYRGCVGLVNVNGEVVMGILYDLNKFFMMYM